MEHASIVYWTFRALLGLQVAFAGVLYFTSPKAAACFAHLGSPNYFRVELCGVKLIAAALLLPMVPIRAVERV